MAGSIPTIHPASSCTIVPKAVYDTDKKISIVEDEAELDNFEYASFGYSISLWESKFLPRIWYLSLLSEHDFSLC